jgi:hypothetical protein
MNKLKNYQELTSYSSFIDRYKYLKLTGQVGSETFGIDRYINQALYKSNRWRETRNKVIIRDNGCDLGVEGYDVYDRIIVHHMNPILLEDIEEDNDDIFDLNYLISTSFKTHNAIHYGDEKLLPVLPKERTRNDTCPWKQGG